MPLKALVLYGYGINCENESRYAIEKSGGKADIVHLNLLLEDPKMLENYNMLMIPGGFSFGDDLGSGKVFGNKMKFRLREPLGEFIKAKKMVLGVCNGFQLMVKMGMLPGFDGDYLTQRTTLTFNDCGRFQDRWVYLKADPASPSVFTKGIERGIYLPMRHGEGKFLCDSDATLGRIEREHLHMGPLLLSRRPAVNYRILAERPLAGFK